MPMYYLIFFNNAKSFTSASLIQLLLPLVGGSNAGLPPLTFKQRTNLGVFGTVYSHVDKSCEVDLSGASE